MQRQEKPQGARALQKARKLPARFSRDRNGTARYREEKEITRKLLASQKGLELRKVHPKNNNLNNKPPLRAVAILFIRLIEFRRSLDEEFADSYCL